MNDEFGNNLATGILIHGIIQEGEAHRAREKDRKTKEEQEKLLKATQALEKQNKNLVANSDGADRAIVMLRKEVEFYKELLAQPMQVIAAHNHDFKKTYEEQQTLLADWMVSQKAFKELAIQLGLEKCMSIEEVIEIAQDNVINVLNDKNNPNHNTNSSDDSFISKRIEVLLEKYEKRKFARQANKGI
jgi:uncharacterized lipoprotein